MPAVPSNILSSPTNKFPRLITSYAMTSAGGKQPPRPPSGSSIAGRFCRVYVLSLSHAHCVVHLITNVFIPGTLQFLERTREATVAIFFFEITLNVLDRKVVLLWRRTALTCKRKLPRQIEYESFWRMPARAVRRLLRIEQLAVIKLKEQVCVCSFQNGE